MAKYPQRLLTDDEEVIREFHPHWRVLLPATGWTVLGAAVIAAGFVWGGDNDLIGWIGLAVGLLVVLVLGVPKFISWRFKIYVLTTERIIVRDGIIRRGSTEIPLENINDVRFTQGVIERLLGHGDVLIESAGSQGQQRLTDVPDPEAFQSEVYRVREVRAMQLGGGGPRDAASQLSTLADLHDRGVLTDEEFAEKKAKLLGDI